MSPRAIHHIAKGLSVFQFDLLRVRREIILKNLRIAFGENQTPKEAVRMGRASVYHFMLTVLEFFRSYYIDPFEQTTLEGTEHIHDALKQGKGVFILCCHLGNFELLGAAGTRFFAPTYSVVKEIGKGGGLNRFVDELRNKRGLLTIYRKPAGAALRAIRDTLRRNEMLGIILDQKKGDGPLIPFFGKPAKTNPSLATIHRRYPAPVIPAFARRTGVGQHVLEALPPLQLDCTDDGQQDVLANTTAFNQIMESMIRRCPEQYFWMHNRWKSR